MFAQTYSYLTIPLMIIIHAGFHTYEMGASRQKNVLASGAKNILTFGFMVPTFYFFGWWVYWAFMTLVRRDLITRWQASLPLSFSTKNQMGRPN